VLVAVTIGVADAKSAKTPTRTAGTNVRKSLLISYLLFATRSGWRMSVGRQADLREPEKIFAKPLFLVYLPIHEARMGQAIG